MTVALANWGSAPQTGKDKIPLGSRQLLPFRKSNGPHAWLTAGTALPLHCWKGNLCIGPTGKQVTILGKPSIGPTAKQVSILAAASCWPLYKTASVCQSWAAAAGVAGGAACRVGTRGAKSLQWHRGAPHMLAAGGGHTRASSSTSPGGAQRRQGSSMDKGPWCCQGLGPTPTGHPARSHVRQPPPGIRPKLCLPEPRGTGWLLQYLWGSIQPWLPGWWERSSFLLALRFAAA